MKCSAVISPCQKYRYQLDRIWDPDLPLCNWVMLNPSTADANVDDPTIRRCMAFSKKWDYGGIDVRNLFALRATNPKELQTSVGEDRKGPDNDFYLTALRSRKVVIAWGSHGSLYGRGARVIEMLKSADVRLFCLGKTKGKQPKHPLFVRSDVELIKWS